MDARWTFAPICFRRQQDRLHEPGIPDEAITTDIRGAGHPPFRTISSVGTSDRRCHHHDHHHYYYYYHYYHPYFHSNYGAADSVRSGDHSDCAAAPPCRSSILWSKMHDATFSMIWHPCIQSDVPRCCANATSNRSRALSSHASLSALFFESRTVHSSKIETRQTQRSS